MFISKAMHHQGGAAEAEGMPPEVLHHVAVAIAPQGVVHAPLPQDQRQAAHVKIVGALVRLRHAAAAAVPLEGEPLQGQLVPGGDLFSIVVQ